MRAIFISYRRNDAEGEAGRLFDDLVGQFGEDSIFMDVAAIQAGRDFRKAIDESVATCGVLLAVIGTNWVDARNEAGQRRLEDPTDFVRLETASALRRDIPVVPVLVRGAKMPRPEQLPDDLRDLAYRNGVELTHARWGSDLQLLIKALRDLLGEAKSDRAADEAAAGERASKKTTGGKSARWLALAAGLMLVVALGAYGLYHSLGKAEQTSPEGPKSTTTQPGNEGALVHAPAVEPKGGTSTRPVPTVPQHLALPTISPNGGTFSDAVAVTFSAEPNAQIRFTRDGSDPTETSTLFLEGRPLTLRTTTTLKARAYRDDRTVSEVATASFTVMRPPAMPTISPNGGTFSGAVTVTVSSDPDAQIRVTRDGSDPTEQSRLLAAGQPLTFATTTTLKARAYRGDNSVSRVASATFTFPTPATGDAGARSGLAGLWTEIDPRGSRRPLVIRIDQTGDVADVYLSYTGQFTGAPFGRATIRGGVATFTVVSTCAPAYQTRGYEYPNGASGASRFTLTLRGSTLLYEVRDTKRAPCGGNPVGTTDRPPTELRKVR